MSSRLVLCSCLDPRDVEREPGSAKLETGEVACREMLFGDPDVPRRTTACSCYERRSAKSVTVARYLFLYTSTSVQCFLHEHDHLRATPWRWRCPDYHSRGLFALRCQCRSIGIRCARREAFVVMSDLHPFPGASSSSNHVREDTCPLRRSHQ